MMRHLVLTEQQFTGFSRMTAVNEQCLMTLVCAEVGGISIALNNVPKVAVVTSANGLVAGELLPPILGSFDDQSPGTDKPEVE